MSADLNVILPEIILSLYAMLALVGAVYTGKDSVAPALLRVTSLVFLLIAAWIGLAGGAATQTAFGGMFVDDAFARFSKVLILASAAVVLLMGEGYFARKGELRFEYPLLIALAVVGMMFMVSAGDLMALYMGLELQSLALYVVASVRRDNAKSTEAGLKYFVLGALSSGLLLYGAALVYGYSGTTQFAGIIETARHGEVSLALLFGLVFLISGFAFKVSAVPFHMWTPDVYEGAPTPITAFFATAPKVAAIMLFARVMHDAFGAAIQDWSQVVSLLAILSMFLGAIAAIGQRDIKRLMAYSSIAHMGYALIGLAAGNETGVEAMLLYMAVYVTMNIGTFAFILMMERDGQAVTDIGSLNMFARQDPLKAWALLFLLCSLAGIPPFMGFFAKFGVWIAALEADLVYLVIASAIASAIGAFYYLRIVYFMFFGEDRGVLLDPVKAPVLSICLLASAAVMLIAVPTWFGLEAPAQIAAASLVN